MSQKEIQELLSAYLDGELPPAEKAAVESGLEESLELREELAALTEMSQQVRMLPRPCAPPELRIGVLERLDRPAATLSAGLGRPPSDWMSYAVRWSGALAAGLLVMVGIWALTPAGRDAQLAQNHKLQSDQRGDQTIMATAAPASPYAAEMATESNLMTAAPEPVVQVVNVPQEEIRRRIDELQQPLARGNTIRVPTRMRAGEEEIPIVVVFTVVDVMEAMNQMQVLVQQEQVRSRLDERPLLVNQQADPQLTAVTLELAMDGPEMAAVLNGVPAVDAVMFVDHDSAIPSAESEMPNMTRSAPGSASQAPPQIPSLAAAPMADTPNSNGTDSSIPAAEALSASPLRDERPSPEINAGMARNQSPPSLGLPASQMQQRFNFQALAVPADANTNQRTLAQDQSPSDAARGMTMMRKSEADSAPSSPGAGTNPNSATSKEGALAQESDSNSLAGRARTQTQVSQKKPEDQQADWNDARRFRAYILLKQQAPPAIQAPQQ